MNTRYSITFPPEKIREPIISRLIKNHNLEINILNADVSSGKTGKLVVEIKGDKNSLSDGLTFLKIQGVFYKQILKELFLEKENCIACGSCTGVCFSDALSLNKNTFELEVNPGLCILCGICIKACPLQLISLNKS